MPYSKEFRGEVLAACEANEGTQAIALRFNVSESWVRRIKQQRRETGQIAAKTTRNRKPIWRGWADWLVAKVAELPDIYLRELQAALKSERGELVCLQTIWFIRLFGGMTNSWVDFLRHDSDVQRLQ